MRQKMRLNENTFERFFTILKDYVDNKTYNLNEIPKITKIQAHNQEHDDLKNEQTLKVITELHKLLDTEPELFNHFFETQENLKKWFKKTYLFNNILIFCISSDRKESSFYQKASILLSLAGNKILLEGNTSFNFSDLGGRYHTKHDNIYEEAISKKNKEAFTWLLKNQIGPFDYKIFEITPVEWMNELLSYKSYVDFLSTKDWVKIDSKNINRIGNFWPLFKNFINDHPNQKIKLIENKYKAVEEIDILQWKFNTLNSARTHHNKYQKNNTAEINAFIIDFIEQHSDALNQKIPDYFDGMKPTLVKQLILNIQGIDKEKIESLINLKTSLFATKNKPSKIRRF